MPAELRAVAAARRVASVVGMVLRDLRGVVRGPCTAGLDEETVAELLGLPLAGELPAEPGLSQALGGGRPTGAGRRGPLARFCGAFWEQTLGVARYEH